MPYLPVGELPYLTPFQLHVLSGGACPYTLLSFSLQLSGIKDHAHSGNALRVATHIIRFAHCEGKRSQEARPECRLLF